MLLCVWHVICLFCFDFHLIFVITLYQILFQLALADVKTDCDQNVLYFCTSWIKLENWKMCLPLSVILWKWNVCYIWLNECLNMKHKSKWVHHYYYILDTTLWQIISPFHIWTCCVGHEFFHGRIQRRSLYIGKWPCFFFLQNVPSEYSGILKIIHIFGEKSIP